MSPSRSIVTGLIFLLPFTLIHAQGKDPCGSKSLPHQQKDAATIQRIEASWNLASAQGDTEFERCLLTDDFQEILARGELKTLTDQLGYTAKNKGQNKPVPELPPLTVFIHGNVAIAHGVWKPANPDHKPDEVADYFIWEDGAWHAFFSQSTPVNNDEH